MAILCEIYTIDSTSQEYLDTLKNLSGANKLNVGNFLLAMHVIIPIVGDQEPTLLMLRGKQESLVFPNNMALTSLPLIRNGSSYKLDTASTAFEVICQDIPNISGKVETDPKTQLSSIEIMATSPSRRIKVGSLVLNKDLILRIGPIPLKNNQINRLNEDLNDPLRIEIDGRSGNLSLGDDVPEIATSSSFGNGTSDITISNKRPLIFRIRTFFANFLNGGNN